MKTAGMLVALAGIVIGASALTQGWKAREEAPPAVAVGKTELATSAEVARLRDALAAELVAREELAEELEGLRDLVARLGVAAARVDEEATDEDAEFEVDIAPEVTPGGNRFNVAQLVEAGLLGREVRWLREQYDQYQLDRLYLRDEGTRQGWYGTGRLRDERIALDDELREELGLEMYDWMLYGSGQTNRVFVREIIAGSAAERAGLRAGDVIVRYASRQVYTVRELRRLTTEGQLGELVFVEVERGSSSPRFELPRGPLGVRLRAERTAPPAP